MKLAAHRLEQIEQLSEQLAEAATDYPSVRTIFEQLEEAFRSYHRDPSQAALEELADRGRAFVQCLPKEMALPEWPDQAFLDPNQPALEPGGTMSPQSPAFGPLVARLAELFEELRS